MNRPDEIKVFSRASDLPQEWDMTAGERVFLRSNSLRALEETNPCEQLYRLAGEGSSCSIAVTYQHKLNLLTYGIGSLSLPTTIVGIPCSVSDPGLHLVPDTEAQMMRHLHEIKGTKLILNTGPHHLKGFQSENTLPNCQLTISWNHFSCYLSSMRSHYRHRVKQALARGTSMILSQIEPGEFGEDLYGLYENVFNRSRYKLEKLSIGFFNRFPSKIIQFKVGDKPIAFVQTIQNGRELVFMFAGMDYSTSKQYDTYLNILLYLVKEGIEAGCHTINMGQTAEEIKCKLGCKLVPRHMHAAHSNRIENRVLQSFSGLLGYKQKEHEYRVFKQAQT